jgi:hypothetical protein
MVNVSSIILLVLFSFKSFSNDFDQFEKTVHIIKIKSSKSGSTTSRGTGFTVNEDGKVLTNFHVISRLFKEGKVNKDYKAYVKVGKAEYLAKVVKFDIMSDLALLEIPYQFQGSVIISNEKVKKGSKIYSLGFHDKEFMSINQGIFSDNIKDSSNKLMALSISLNSGMSGGPILNKSLEVIGVNVLKSRRKQSSGYGINREKLVTFLNHLRVKNDSLENILNKQIRNTHDQIVTSINQSEELGSLNNWKTPDVEKFLYCREYSSDKNLDKDKNDKNQNKIKEKYKVCNMDPRKVPLSAMGSNIRISFGIGNITGSKNTHRMTFYNYINNSFKFRKFRNLFRKKDYSCKKDYVKNEHGTSFKVSICAFKYNRVPGYIKNEDYFKFNVKAVTINNEMDDIVLNLQFSGGAKLAKTIVKNVLSNIYKKKEQEREIAQEE